MTILLTACVSDQAPLGSGAGELGKGSLSIICSPNDATCAGDQISTKSNVAIAAGASFTMTYHGQVPRSPSGEPTAMTLLSASPQMLSITNNEFIARLPGQVAVLARTAEGIVTDFTHFRIESIDQIRIDGPATLSLGSKTKFEATPLSGDTRPLAGNVDYSWQVDGLAVEVTSTHGRSATIAALKPGRAILRATSLQATGELAINVEDAQ